MSKDQRDLKTNIQMTLYYVILLNSSYVGENFICLGDTEGNKMKEYLLFGLNCFLFSFQEEQCFFNITVKKLSPVSISLLSLFGCF